MIDTLSPLYRVLLMWLRAHVGIICKSPVRDFGGGREVWRPSVLFRDIIGQGSPSIEMSSRRTVPIPGVVEELPRRQAFSDDALLRLQEQNTKFRGQTGNYGSLHQVSHSDSPAGLPSFPTVVVGASPSCIDQVAHPVPMRLPQSYGRAVLPVPKQAPKKTDNKENSKQPNNKPTQTPTRKAIQDIGAKQCFISLLE